MTGKETLHSLMMWPEYARLVHWPGPRGDISGYLSGPKMDDNYWIVAYDLTDKPDRETLHYSWITYDGETPFLKKKETKDICI